VQPQAIESVLVTELASATTREAASAGDVGAVVANHIAATGFDDLPAAAIESAKQSILDTIGVILAAGSFPGVSAVVDVVREQGGREEATILGYGDRVPASMAAFANGSMGHCVDYDDYHDVGLHPSTPTVPSALATAEREGASGKELIAAVALANDFGTRLACAVEWKADVPGLAWYTSPLFGYFSGTAAAGKILGLDGKQMFNAFGIAFCQAGGTLEMIHSPGSDVGGLNAAWPNKCGVLSALLAQRGVGGVPTAFEGRLGFFNMFFGGEYDRDVITDGLGERFRGTEVSFKPWPACGGAHPAIEAALEVVNAHEIDPDDVREITVTVHTRPAWNLCEPFEARSRPRTIRDAKYSIPFAVAVAVANRRVALGDFTVESLDDERVLRLAAAVRPVYEEDEQAPHALLSPSTVTVVTGEGSFAHRVERSRGRQPRPLERDELAEKFRDCASRAVTPLSAAQVEAAIQLVDRLDDLADVRELTATLSAR
jgi:2-methylcitrate dehydratase PrpD